MSEEKGQEAKTGQEATAEEKTFSAEYVKELREEAKSHRIKVQELATQIEEFRTAQQTKEQEAAAKRGEFEELWKNVSQEKETLAEQNARLEAELGAFRKMEEEKLEKILDKIPENLKQHLDDSLPLQKRIALANDLLQTIDSYKGNPQARLPGAQNGMPEGLSAKEQLNWTRRQGNH